MAATALSEAKAASLVAEFGRPPSPDPVTARPRTCQGWSPIGVSDGTTDFFRFPCSR